MLRAGVGTIRQWVAPGPDRPGRGPVYGEGLRPGSLVRLAGPCLGAKPLVSRRHLIPAPVRAAGGLNGLVHHRLLTNRPARGAGCSSWVLRTLPRPPRASAWVADSGVSSSRPTIRSLPFLPWSSGPPGSAWVSLACTTAQLPRERGRRRMEDPGRAARRGVVDIQAKTPARETGPKPQSSERGVITLWE